MMSSVFDKTYHHYLSQLAGISIEPLKEKLGIGIKDHSALIPLFTTTYNVSAKGVFYPDGREAPIEVSIVLCRYLLMCPDNIQPTNEWSSYKDFKDSGPLTVYYKNDVEMRIANTFSGHPDELGHACRCLKGIVPEQEYPYDLCIRFTALPRIPILLLFNDADEEFPATCSVLMNKNADQYLDAECLAIIGSIFAYQLKNR